MIVRKVLVSFLLTLQTLVATSYIEQFNEIGYVEISNNTHSQSTFNNLYAQFDELIEFLQTHPAWEKKLYTAKERFIRTKERNYYSTDFFGFIDESKRDGRNQIAFYYSTHFQDFISSYYPEFQHAPEIIRFLETCRQIQEPCGKLFEETAKELELTTIFSSKRPPVLFKVIKYLPSYMASRPHYDGTAFSLFLDSTDNESLLISPYKDSFNTDDFFSPPRELNSMLLIPGMLLTEFSIFPTPHIVVQSNKARYSTIAFAMRPNFSVQKIELSPLPNFKH